MFTRMPNDGVRVEASGASKSVVLVASNNDRGKWQKDQRNDLLNREFSRSWVSKQVCCLPARISGNDSGEWQRPYWLGASLCLVLFAFWMLDSLKDPVFGDLVNGNLRRHQPIAKLISVATTLALVLFLEFLSNARQSWQQRQEERQSAHESVLGMRGTWNRMRFEDAEEPPELQNCHAESSLLVYILVSYVVTFALIARFLEFRPRLGGPRISSALAGDGKEEEAGLTSLHFAGYFIYATIESFGSLAVAYFWSFANTTLSLDDAERYYGPIIAIAQLGAIGGSTMVTTFYPETTLFYLACLIVLLHLVVMNLYSRRFRPTNTQAIASSDDVFSEMADRGSRGGVSRGSTKFAACATKASGESSTLWSGVHLILRYNYVLLLLGVSCLYEVSLTCLDYQMKLIGYSRYELSKGIGQEGPTFLDFMGHYGQVVNATSFFLSLVGFPWLIRLFGLKYTLRLFPTLLLLATTLTFGALPRNLAVLFVSMAILKAMTYSIHDPSKELLYLPASNAIKFKAKFWIDVVGARVAKAIGSTINTYAGSVDRSVAVGSMPSFLTAVLLWVACYCAGREFDRLISCGMIVGLHEEEAPNDDDCE